MSAANSCVYTTKICAPKRCYLQDKMQKTSDLLELQQGNMRLGQQAGADG